MSDRNGNGASRSQRGGRPGGAAPSTRGGYGQTSNTNINQQQLLNPQQGQMHAQNQQQRVLAPLPMDIPRTRSTPLNSAEQAKALPTFVPHHTQQSMYNPQQYPYNNAQPQTTTQGRGHQQVPPFLLQQQNSRPPLQAVQAPYAAKQLVVTQYRQPAPRMNVRMGRPPLAHESTTGGDPNEHIKLDNSDMINMRGVSNYTPMRNAQGLPYHVLQQQQQQKRSYPGQLPQTMPRSHQGRQGQMHMMHMIPATGYPPYGVQQTVTQQRPLRSQPKEEIKRTPLAILDDEGVELNREEIEAEKKAREQQLLEKKKAEELAEKKIQPVPVYTGPAPSANPNSSSSSPPMAITPSRSPTLSGRTSRAVSDAEGRPALEHPPAISSNKQILTIESPPTSPNGVAYQRGGKSDATSNSAAYERFKAPPPISTGVGHLEPRSRANSSTKTPFSTPVAKSAAMDDRYSNQFKQMEKESMLLTVDELERQDHVASERSLLQSTESSSTEDVAKIPRPEAESDSGSDVEDQDNKTEEVSQESGLVKEFRADKDYGKGPDGTYAYAVALLRAYRHANPDLPSQYPVVPKELNPARVSSGAPPGLGGAPPGMSRGGFNSTRYEDRGGHHRNDRGHHRGHGSHGSGHNNSRGSGGYQQHHDRRHNRGNSGRYNDHHRGGGRHGSRDRYSQNDYAYDGPVEKLQRTANAWIAGQGSDTEYDKTRKKIVEILNKLTVEKFNTLGQQLLALVGQQLNNIDEVPDEALRPKLRDEWTKEVVKKIYEKALLDQHFASIYAELCKMLSDKLTEISPDVNFRRQLILQCQVEFEQASEHAEDGVADNEEERKEMEFKLKKRKLGNIRFIGELFKKDLLKAKLMFHCIQFLFGNDFLSGKENVWPDTEDLESMCSLLATVGGKLETSKMSDRMNSIFRGIARCGHSSSQLPNRIRFMCLDTIELRRAKWVPRREKVVAKTLKEIRDEHARASQQSGKGNSRNASAMQRGGRDIRLGGRQAPKRQPKSSRYDRFAGASSSSSGDVRGNIGRGSTQSSSQRNSSSSSSFGNRENRDKAPPLLGKPNQMAQQQQQKQQQQQQQQQQQRARSPSPEEDEEEEELFPGELSAAELLRQKKITSFLTEFKNHNSFREFEEDVKDLGGTEHHKEVIRELIRFYAEKANMRDMLLNLSLTAFENSILTTQNFADGVGAMLYLLPDMTEDNLNAGIHIGDLFAHWFHDNVVSAEVVLELLKQDEFATSGKFSHAGKIVAKAVQTTAKLVTEESESDTASGLPTEAAELLATARTLMPDIVTDDFVARHNLS